MNKRWIEFLLWAAMIGCVWQAMSSCTSKTTPSENPGNEEKVAPKDGGGVEMSSKEQGSPDNTPKDKGPVNAHEGIGKMTPEQCGSCHKQHFEEWRGSMHAYAAKDPIFLAMNAKGQIDTKGKLGQFCVQCHAPVGSKLELTPVKVNEKGQHYMVFDMKNPLVGHGVQCVTCHNMASVEATLNAKFKLSGKTYYGPTGSAAANKVHPMEKSSILTQSLMCGTCHNVVNPKGALLENTFSEWYASDFNGHSPQTTKRCQDCHMKPYQGPITVGGPVRTLHRHRFVGVDQALIPDFPYKKEQAELVRKQLQGCVELKLERRPDAEGKLSLFVSVKNINNGHNLPSGSTADRQVWIHLTITDTQDKTLLYESGMMDKNGDLMDRITGHSLTPAGDPFLLMFSQFLFGEQGEHVTFPWQAKRTEDKLLGPGQAGWREYLLPKDKFLGKTVEVKAVLKYRTFPPFLIRKLEEEGYLKKGAIEPVPVVEMASKSLTLTIR